MSAGEQTSFKLSGAMGKLSTEDTVHICLTPKSCGTFKVPKRSLFSNSIKSLDRLLKTTGTSVGSVLFNTCTVG